MGALQRRIAAIGGTTLALDDPDETDAPRGARSEERADGGRRHQIPPRSPGRSRTGRCR